MFIFLASIVELRDYFTRGCSYLILLAGSQISHPLIEMSTIAKVFDIDQHTGFMASDPSPDRLPHFWEAWEIVLDAAIESRLQVGDKIGLTDEERATSKRWRDRVRAVRTILSTI